MAARVGAAGRGVRLLLASLLALLAVFIAATTVSVGWFLGAVAALAVYAAGGAVEVYYLGRHRGLLRARAVVEHAHSQPPTLGPMPPERAWALCCERLARMLEKA